MKTVLSCIKNVSIVKTYGSLTTKIDSIEYDSRKIEKREAGAAFFALPGIHTDGKNFIDNAIRKGAVCIFYEGSLTSFVQNICYVQVENVRQAMASVSSAFYDNPAEDLTVIGVTGTEGKSSTVSFIFQLLKLCGEPAGFFSTVEYSTGGAVIPNPEHQTTPESNTVQQRLAQMRNSNCKYAVIEASSHGLSAETARLAGVLFDAGVFMNVTQEHLEFHGTFECYRSDKANLFRSLDLHNKNIKKFGIVNCEDKSADYFVNATKQPVYLFSTEKKDLHKIKTAGGLLAIDVEEKDNGISFTLCGYFDGTEIVIPVFINVCGLFNVKNILAAMLTVHKITKIPLEEIVAKLPFLVPIKGRMTKIDEGQPFEVIIDYAHTPSSFEVVFPAAKMKTAKRGGKLLCVFGSGGERDLQKRAEQGRIAGEYADVIILADEDPRGEDPFELLEMIAEGCRNKTLNKELFIIPNRPQAINKAFSLAEAGDLVLLLGKGHENSIIYKDKTILYSEEETARNTLKAMYSAV